MQREFESASTQVWICPATKKNLKHSIFSEVDIGNGQMEYAWAFNKKFQKKWISMSEGDICIFGRSKENYSRAAVVKRKQDISELEHWPYRGEDGRTEWSWGFFLEKPFVIDVGYNTLMSNVRQKRFSTQTLLDQECANNVKRLLI